jgi:pilus assembly protein CpaC
MHSRLRRHTKHLLTIGSLLLLLAGTAWAEGLTHPAAKANEPQKLQIVHGKSVVIDTPVSIKRASLADPEIADTVVLSPRQLYVTGKNIGSTSLTLWDSGQVFSVFDLEVVPDLTRLQEQLRQLLPEERNIQVLASHDHIALKGTASNEVSRSEALALAEAYAKGKVINMLQVTGMRPPEVQDIRVDLIKGGTQSSVKFASEGAK